MSPCIDLDRDPRLAKPPPRYVTKISFAVPDTPAWCGQYFFLSEDDIEALVVLAARLERKP